MKSTFFSDTFRKRARFAAILWTLLILLGCLWPGEKIPEVDVPMADKWTHFVLFAGFSFLWLCALPSLRPVRLLRLLLLSAAFGYLVEGLQGLLVFLNRSFDHKDALADAIGGLLGILLFALLASFFRKPAA